MKKTITKTLLVAFIFVLSYTTMAWSNIDEPEPTDEKLEGLLDMSLEELMNLDVTSVSKKEQKYFEAPAAVFVITSDDIQRSGATSIPDLLRMVPGVQVARIDASKWAITVRGFNGRFANKLLVLIDGRSVYTPLYSGVYWDTQDVVLEDIERIEIIRGPGATLWGANAVNGVINVITKNAKDTQGIMLTGGVGDEELGFTSGRYGMKLGENAYLRVYGKYFKRDDARFDTYERAEDDWEAIRGGFRLDWSITEKDSLTFQGDIYDHEVGQTIAVASLDPPYSSVYNETNGDLSGDNVLARWNRTFSETSSLMLQVYYDQTDRAESDFVYDRETLDFEFQHSFNFAKRHSIIWGLGYRFINDNTVNTFAITLNPYYHDEHLFSAFIQDEISLIENKLELTLGTKLEHNNSTDVEVQPNIRLLWLPKKGHAAWASVSRAVRTPSRAENDINLSQSVIPPNYLFTGSPLTLVSLSGKRDYESEDLISYELGYRIMPIKQLTFDIAAFYNSYDELRTTEAGEPYPVFTDSGYYLVAPYEAGNKMDGRTYGVEITATWHPTSWWRILTSYSYLQIQLNPDETSTGGDNDEMEEGQSPHNQLSLRSSFDVTKNIRFDAWLRYVDNLPVLDVKNYTALDCQVAWNPIKNLELSLVGQNLTDNQHPEFSQNILVATYSTEVERSVYFKFKWNMQ